MRVRFEKVFDRTDQVLSGIARAASLGAKAVADAVVVEAKQYARVDTGEMQGSIERRTVWANQYGREEEVAPHTEDAHDLFQELGTSKMAASPYMAPAAAVVATRAEQIAAAVASREIPG